MTPTLAARAQFLAELALGWALAHPVWLLLFGGTAVAVVIAAAVCLYFRYADPADAELDARDAETERLFTTMPRPEELDRFVLPAGAGDPVWVPDGKRHTHRKTSRRAAGVTPSGQPARGGAPDLEARHDAPGKPRRGDLPPLQAPGGRVAAPVGQVQPAGLGELHPRPAGDRDQREAVQVGDALGTRGGALDLGTQTPAPVPGPEGQSTSGHGGEREGRAFHGLNHAGTQTPAPAPCTAKAGHGGGQQGPGPEPSGAPGPAPAQTPGAVNAAAAGDVNQPPPLAAAPGPDLPEAVAAELGKLRAACAELSQAESDAQRWPWLVAGDGYSDSTGSFAAVCAGDE